MSTSGRSRDPPPRRRIGEGGSGANVGRGASGPDPIRLSGAAPLGPDRSPYGGIEKVLEHGLRLDSGESESGGDDGSIEPSSPVATAGPGIPIRPGLARVQSSFTSYSSRSPASRTTSVTSLYDSLGSSAPRTNSAESVPRHSTLKTQMLPPGRSPYSATEIHETLDRPYTSRSTSSSSDARYLPYPPTYSTSEVLTQHGPPLPHQPRHYPPMYQPAPYNHSGYVAAPNTPAYGVPTCAGPAMAPHASEVMLYPAQYYQVHANTPAPVQAPYTLAYPVQPGHGTGLVATADGQYMQLVSPQPFGPPVAPAHGQNVYPSAAYPSPDAYAPHRGAPAMPYTTSGPAQRPLGYAGSEASSPSSYHPGYHFPSPHLLDHHFAAAVSPTSTETSPGVVPVSPFDTTSTQVAYPISTDRSASTERGSAGRRRQSSSQGSQALSVSTGGRETGPEEAAVAQRMPPPPQASRRMGGGPRTRQGAPTIPEAQDRRYPARPGFPAPVLPSPVVLGPPVPAPPGVPLLGPQLAAPGPRSAGAPPRGGTGRPRRILPRPPAHSLHALWVGNVPADASHAELWQFFQTRPTPRDCGLVATPGAETADLDSCGVESIHLITRSNCAFVNYATNLHLHHTIAVTNGVPLRPDDTRSKPLVCRVRKAEDDTKSGVGAQRMGGMHRAFVRAQQAQMQQEQRILREKSPTSVSDAGLSQPDRGMSDQRRKSSVSVNSTGTSIGSTSTTSSFLTKHFERRYFILKSHDIEELHKSVETGLWSTQPHNEPVLQQAYKTARSVYLLFGANGAGSWFGYARMAGPIGTGAGSSASTRSHNSSSAGGRSATSTEQRFQYPDQTIPEEYEGSSADVTPSVPHLLSPSEHRWHDASPLGLTPTTSKSPDASGILTSGGSAPPNLPSISPAEQRAMSQEQELIALETAEKLHLPPQVTEDPRKTVSLGTRPSPPRSPSSPPIKTENTQEGLPGTGPTTPEQDPFVSAAEARNANLENIEAARSRANTVTNERRSSPKGNRTEGVSTPFPIEWIMVRNMPFSRTRHVRNSFNGNREVKISRDGTEIEPTAGELVLNEFWRRDASSRTEVPMRPASPQPVWAGAKHSGHHSGSGASITDEDKTPPGNVPAGGQPSRSSEPPVKSPGMVSPSSGRSETV